MRTLLVSACILSTSYANAQTLTIAAAADLAPLEAPLRAAFASPLRFSFGSSGLLAAQIRNGAPFDVFLSANDSYTQELSKDGALDPATVRAYALGRIGLYGVKSLADLKKPEVRHIAIPNPKHAPYGVAAEEILRRARLLETIRQKLVLGENVRQTWEYCHSGNADACLTSWTLLKDSGAILIPASQHAPIRQSGGVVKGSPHAALARAFLDFLTSIEGQTVLVRGGLNVP